ncbi:DUF1501 domain-containing protein [Lysobacter sp. TY2-98]|uniref:DUF1501 domain-containing protein n=1 Tax=Lysobacter sp. TY2-98 TaxID=2290922 RepID=UPI000E1FF981|nr:DUF1501 domain-containing protein [Lysobacter sp. TY2-98]AXK71538.1 DUF1501 domain-containing protein [Lysobacter sp. TY2-98]
MDPSRRRFLAVAGASASLALWPRLPSFAGALRGNDDVRFIVVLLRGGLDALHALPPVDDPDYARLRRDLAVTDALKLGGGFGLHPSLAFASQLYASKQFLPVVAIAPPYRGRSHFEAQDNVESGGDASAHLQTGWLSRTSAAMAGAEALAVASVAPLSARGPGHVRTWSPPFADDVDPMMLQRLQGLYASDRDLAPSFADAMQRSGDMGSSGALRLPQAMQAAATFMRANDGPRVAFVEDTGWDSHGGQAYQLKRKLGELDAGLRAFHDAAQSIWPKTVVAIVTEFGRTAAANGTDGTDHGTGGVAFLAGGAVRGGRIAGDWPGLSPSALFEGRDLHATTDLRAVFKGVLADHMGLDRGAIDRQVFPDSVGARPMTGLIA